MFSFKHFSSCYQGIIISSTIWTDKLICPCHHVHLLLIISHRTTHAEIFVVETVPNPITIG
ncbi:hypothetical protein J437_LFUL017949 [Ladona fulva]|uniref:Uncharacterized protein n=1 Tax=Ladona fulva TaxID=123851 RepID=A0A8K0PDJ8_LADFU|nr:hypothetical protein J437_LFUL017949 [Ladona fulva]